MSPSCSSAARCTTETPTSIFSISTTYACSLSDWDTFPSSVFFASPLSLRGASNKGPRCGNCSPFKARFLRGRMPKAQISSCSIGPRGAISARIYSYKKELAGSTSSLTTVACTDADIDRWLDHVDSTPFCILRLSEEGALLFALKLPGDKNVWVALDGRQGEPLTADGVKHALARLDPATSLTEAASVLFSSFERI